MKEIIDASKKIKSPIIDVKLKPQFVHTESMYRRVRGKIEKTVLDEVVDFYKVILFIL